MTGVQSPENPSFSLRLNVVITFLCVFYNKIETILTQITYLLINIIDKDTG